MNNDSHNLYAAAQSRTDAKLRYAEVHLGELHTAERRGDDFDRAHQESFLFHLLGVRDAFLQELNIHHGCGLEIKSVNRRRIEQVLINKGTRSAALEGLSTIENDQDSWLAHATEMRNHSTHRNSIPRVYHQGGENHGGVHLTDTRSGNVLEKDYVRIFEQWVEEMRDLIQRLRNEIS